MLQPQGACKFVISLGSTVKLYVAFGTIDSPERIVTGEARRVCSGGPGLFVTLCIQVRLSQVSGDRSYPSRPWS